MHKHRFMEQPCNYPNEVNRLRHLDYTCFGCGVAL